MKTKIFQLVKNVLLFVFILIFSLVVVFSALLFVLALYWVFNNNIEFTVVFASISMSIVFFTVLLISTRNLRRTIHTKNWPHVKGTVLTSKVKAAIDETGGAYFPAVTYEYTVNQTKYTSERIKFAFFQESWFKRRIKRTVDRFPAGKITDVYYNPNDPGTSVLIVGITKSNVFDLLFSLVGLVASFNLLFTSI
ncbi:MAG: DUF3592 domain-containing protein [Candidatus Odinarchaeota archaeon]